MSKYIVGLTGGIGSGKTAVSILFEKLGIAVIDADICSRIVVEKGKPALHDIQHHFGSGVLNNDGTLNRAELRKKVFADRKERIWLEKLLHPLINKELHEQLAKATSAYAVLVSPLLIESGQNALCQMVIVVDVPEAIQIERTIQRDNNSKEQVESIISTQATREKRLSVADEIINNTESMASLEKTVAEMHKKIITKVTAHK